MSRAQGPRAKRGDATVANVAGRRQFGVPVMFDLSEAADMSRGAGPPRSGDATGELAQATDNVRYDFALNPSEVV